MITTNSAGLRGESLFYSYGKSPALRGVTIDVKPGEIVAISGPSGCGKSTLLLTLAGVLRPDAGSVTFDGVSVSDASESTRSRLRRSTFGVLFQFGQLVPELTAAENVALPLLLSGQRRDQALDGAHTWLQRFGVDNVADERPSAMSGGQMQRVAVARSMVTDPNVLFADEPTAALDGLASDQVMAQIVRVARESGTSVLLVTHDSKIAAYGDRDVFMRDGVVEQATAKAE